MQFHLREYIYWKPPRGYNALPFRPLALPHLLETGCLDLRDARQGNCNRLTKRSNSGDASTAIRQGDAVLTNPSSERAEPPPSD